MPPPGRAIARAARGPRDSGPGERHEPLEGAVAAAKASEPVRQHAACEEISELPLHISGLLTTARITAVLDEADRLDASLGDHWRVVSQCERGAP
jgi:hypothetical protein